MAGVDVLGWQHGQICMSTEIVLAHRSIAKALTEKLASLADSWSMTSAVSEAGLAKAEVLVQDALNMGSVAATTLHASSKTKTTGEAGEEPDLRLNKSTLRPVILTRVTPEMRIYSEETFGPSVSILEFDTEQEAIRLTNDSSYGLSSSIFTRNIPKALSMARKIEAGAVHINSMTIHDEPQLPHGGTKSSGWGRFGVPWGKSCRRCCITFVCLSRLWVFYWA
jgi:acyl-CoA reductase-like NAD-dependent aldehyde dehydrogenase